MTSHKKAIADALATGTGIVHRGDGSVRAVISIPPTTSTIDTAKLRALCDAATAGEWFVDEQPRLGGAVSVRLGGLPRQVASASGQAAMFDSDARDSGEVMLANAAFIAASRTALPAALDRIEELERECERLRKLFDDAGQGEHNVLALIDHYQDEASRAEHERDAYRSMLCDLVAAAQPHAANHERLADHWRRARDLLKNGPATDGAIEQLPSTRRHAVNEQGECAQWCNACRDNRSRGLNPDGTRKDPK